MENPKKFLLNYNTKNDDFNKLNDELKINSFYINYLRYFNYYYNPTKSSILMKNLRLSSKSEFLSGYFAACTSITILFPLNKLIFRQILEGISFKDAFKQIKTEGLANMYRGLLPPLLQKSVSYSIMFGTQNEYYVWLKQFTDNSNLEIIKSKSPLFRHLAITNISAALAGLTEATLTPLERVQAVLQMQQFTNTYRHTLHVFQDIINNYGYRELYRGFSAICFRNSFSNALFFSIRTPLKSAFPVAKTDLENSFYDFLSGGLLGAFISTIIYPLNVVKSHMQARVGGKNYSITEAFQILFESRDRNITKLYRGVWSNFNRAVLGWGITNMSYEFALNFLNKKNKG
jgi:hypothetical protein